MADLDLIVDNIKDKPFLVYYLFNKYLTGDDTRLPKFISRKKIVPDLINLGLIEFIISSKKDLHYKETKFTFLGNQVYSKLDSIGVFTIFQDISLFSRDSFITRYESRLYNLEESIKYPQSIFYKIILKNIGDLKKWNRNGNVDYRVIEINVVKMTEEFEILGVSYEFKCESCQKSIIQFEELTYFINADDNLPFQIKCDECKMLYRICKKFQCFFHL